MEVKGRVTHILPEQTGEGRNGQWRKQSFVIEMPGTYPKSVCFDVWGANIDAFGIKQNDEVIASVDIESREYNGKWYTNVKAWKVVKDQPQEHTASVSAPPTDQSWPTPADEVKATPTSSSPSDFDDLPF
jgi:hypothetical protein